MKQFEQSIQDLYQQLSFPQLAYVGQKIFKNLFYQDQQISKLVQKLIQDNVEAFYLLFNITTDNCHIAPVQTDEVEYLEIQVLHIQLRNQLPQSKLTSLFEALHKAIPYPLIIIATHKQQIQFSLAEKRINQAERAHEKLVLQENVSSDWIVLTDLSEIEKEFIDHIRFNKLSRQNMLVLYKGFIKAVTALNLANKTGRYQWLTTDEALVQQRQRLQEIQNLEKMIVELTTKMNKEVQFNSRVGLSIRIKKLNNDLSVLSRTE
tara:strand:+ start:12706 stop:13494 length:789 start_codon:yes stop_codon:yes gene_type:complete